MERLVQGRAGTITLHVFDDDGVAVDADAAPTVTVYDGAGVQVSTGTATDIGTGVYQYTVPASVTDDLDTYSAVWSYDLDGSEVTETTIFDTCGQHLFSIAYARGREASLQDTIRFPAAALKEARVAAEQRFEEGAMLAFTPRPAREVLDGKGRSRLRLGHVEVRELYAISVDGTDWDQTDIDAVELDPSTGELIHPTGVWPVGNQNIVVFYEHGLDTCPQPVSQAVAILATEYLIPSAIPSRASVQYTDGGAFRLSIAGRDGETGIPDVDAVMATFGRRRPSV